jgi:hypothetical protein
MNKSIDPKTLNQVSISATSQGLGPKLAATTKTNCPFDHPPASKPLEYCDIKQLTIELSSEKKSATMVIDRDRKPEPVVRDQVAEEYHDALGSYDLVIEALADIQDMTGIIENPGDVFRLGEVQQKASDGANPLNVKITAVDKVSHTSFQPAHPHTSLTQFDLQYMQTHGGAPVNGTYWSPEVDEFGGFWGRVWSFGDNRVRRYALVGRACGTLPIPQKTTRLLAAQLVVFPYEEWTITIGLNSLASGSSSKEYNSAKIGNEDGGSKTRRVHTTRISKNRYRGNETSTKTEEMKTNSGMSRSRTETAEREIEFGVLSSESHTVKSIEESWQKSPRNKEDDDKDLRKVSIKHKLGGRVVECDATETINNILKIGELFKNATKLFESVKIGWSISMSYEILGGNLQFGWGYRWPKSYTEDQRVYYVERFIEAGGEMTLASGSVTGFFGVKIDPWFLPVSVEIGGYLSIVIKVSVSAGVDYSYTNKATAPAAVRGSLNPTASANIEAGLKAAGRVKGYSVDGKFALQASCSLVCEGEISTANPPSFKGTLMVGSESESDPKEADAVRLIGELMLAGESVQRWKIRPIVLVKGGVIFKDRYFWGSEPAKV